MTRKQYKSLSRKKVELYSKIFKYLAVIIVTYLVGYLTIETFIITTVWMTIGDIFAYLLECKYKIKHNTCNHR